MREDRCLRERDSKGERERERERERGRGRLTEKDRDRERGGTEMGRDRERERGAGEGGASGPSSEPERGQALFYCKAGHYRDMLGIDGFMIMNGGGGGGEGAGGGRGESWVQQKNGYTSRFERVILAQGPC